jgi:hypothetical protein
MVLSKFARIGFHFVKFCIADIPFEGHAVSCSKDLKSLFPMLSWFVILWIFYYHHLGLFVILQELFILRYHFITLTNFCKHLPVTLLKLLVAAYGNLPMIL